MFIVSISMLLTYQVDSVVPKITKENSERQTFLMHHVLAHVNRGVRNKILRYKDENDACGDSPSRSWKGVQCTDGLVTTFCYDPGEWEVPSIGNFCIEWLPHSVQCLDLSFAMQFYGINTRLLPKRLARNKSHAERYLWAGRSAAPPTAHAKLQYEWE